MTTKLMDSWQRRPLGKLVQERGGCTPAKVNPLYWSGTIPWVSPKDMKRELIGDSIDHVSETALQETTLHLVPVGSVLIVVRGMILAHTVPVAQTVEPVTINQDMKALIPGPSLEPAFLRWLAKSAQQQLLGLVEEAGHGTRCLRSELWKALQVSFPSRPIQRIIANFLDRKTAAIDALIEKKERLIALLAEKRAALIHQAVTKGLDPSVSMKDSGNLFVGEIPAHWSTTQPRYVCSQIIDGPHVTPDYVDAGVPFVTVKNLTAGPGISFEDCKCITPVLFDSLRRRAQPKRGDILLSKDGTLGIPRVVETDRDFMMFVSVALLKVMHQECDSYFLRYALEANSTKSQFQAGAAGSGLKHIVLGTIGRVVIPCPPLAEQKLIAEGVRRGVALIEGTQAQLDESIERLREYRQALITAAVTGQLEIPEEG